MRSTLKAIGVMVVGSLATISCNGGTSSPTTPGSGVGTLLCRNAASASTAVSVVGNALFANEITTCSYSTSANQLTCNVTHTETNGCSYDLAVVSNYSAVADFVDEVTAIPPRKLLTREVSTPTRFAGCRFFSESTTAYSYDGQRRVTQSLKVQGGAIQTNTNTAWDAAGRPTMTTVNTVGFVHSESWAYDDVAR